VKTVLITGAEGFVGGNLFSLLKEEGFTVYGTFLPELRVKRENYFGCNILDFDGVSQLIKQLTPEVVFHLAAISSVGQSFREPLITFRTNIIGTLNLLDAIRLFCPDSQFFFISSCEVYGDGGSSIDESAPIALTSPYATSKYSAELIINQYRQAYDLKTVILRPFNHTGPGQRDDFILSSVARQIAEIEREKKPPVISVGNIEVIREFMDARDVVRAYCLAIEYAKSGDLFNVASGVSHSIKEALEIFKKKAKKKVKINIDKTRFRRHDIMTLLGNGGRFTKLTGFNVQIPFEKTLEDLLNYWRAKIGQ